MPLRTLRPAQLQSAHIALKPVSLSLYVMPLGSTCYLFIPRRKSSPPRTCCEPSACQYLADLFLELGPVRIGLLMVSIQVLGKHDVSLFIPLEQ
jgi:hypothetical protein